IVAGRLAALSAGLSSGATGDITAAQIANIRATNWNRLRDVDLRRFSLTVRVAKEWLVLAASRPDLRADLSRSLPGILPSKRTVALMSALDDGNWSGVWRSLTMGDLYSIGSQYIGLYPDDPWHSPVTESLRRIRAQSDPERLHVLGRTMTRRLDHTRPRLHPVPPYEEF
ncbi:MAG: hypothetical protein GY953_38675, partial [bacterium]|nr:hypothetical protein [bacterium]